MAGAPSDLVIKSLNQTTLGKASLIRTLGNIVVSIIGTGVLSLPYTFRTSGWVTGSLAVILSACLSYYCMLLLVNCRNRLEEQGRVNIVTYGDLGNHVQGSIGRGLVDSMVMITQSGSCVAYLIFIGQNLSSIFTSGTEKQTPFIVMLLPLLILLGWVRSLARLASFSILADVCNVMAMAIVIKDDFESFQGYSRTVGFRHWSGFFFAFGIAVFCYEGFAITLSLEASMKKPHFFPRILAQAFIFITLLYVAFGIIGYFAFGDSTEDIITLNLPNDWSTIAVKAGLCIALTFTFPMMMIPVYEILENKLIATTYYQSRHVDWPRTCKFVLDGIRSMSVLIVAAVAIMVPVFTVFISFVGSTMCAMLAFVFPAFFHLHVFKGCMSRWEWGVDWLLIVGGIAFAIFGTISTCLEALL